MLGKYHCAAAVGLLLALLAALFLGVAMPLMDRYGVYRAEIDRMSGQYERFARVVASRPALEAQLKTAQKEDTSKGLYLAEQTEVLAATDLQSRVKKIIESTGGTLQSIQNLRPAGDEPFQRVAIKVKMTGDTRSLQRILHAIASEQPLMFTDDLQVQARQVRRKERVDGKRVVRVETKLTVTFDLFGYMRKRVGAAG